MMLENEQPSNPVQPSPAATWGGSAILGVCESCDGRFLTLAPQFSLHCPHCHVGKLQQLDEEETAQMTEFIRPPEMILPFTVQPASLGQQVEQFASGLQFPPDDLKVENLSQRLQRIFLPVWLVDVQVKAAWQAEAGFNYQVKSHQERYGDGGGWQTREVMETRQRWEPRLGQLERGYQNVAAPALEAHQQWMDRLGKYDYEKAQAYKPGDVLGAEAKTSSLVSLPDRSQQDAWPTALPIFQSLAAEESRQACGADHIREFRWLPEFTSQNWTLLLLPVFSTFYLDDENKPQPILVHGQSGKLSGVRRASMRRAQRVSLIIFLVALVVLLLGICVGGISALNPVLLPLAGVVILTALLIALGAIYPVVAVWMINNK